MGILRKPAKTRWFIPGWWGTIARCLIGIRESGANSRGGDIFGWAQIPREEEAGIER
jgi:hypothetical protein